MTGYNMRSIIIDDELPNRENLRVLLKRYCPEAEVVAEAADVEEGLKVIHLYQPDLLFLDIQLHGRSGFELLKQLSGITFEIIFITAYNNYGIQAVKFAALDYLLKPIDIEELQLAVKKASDKLSKKKRNERLEYLVDYLKTGRELPLKIALPQNKEILYIEVKEIIRCEANNMYTNFFLNTGEKILVSQTLKENDTILSAYGFIRTHQSHLVNINYVRSWLKEDGGCLLLKDHTRIPVSKVNREKIKSILSHQTPD